MPKAERLYKTAGLNITDFTDEEYTKIEELPKWVYVFLILNAINLINGAIGGICAAFGMILTLKVCSLKTNIFIKLVLNILILLAMFGMVFEIVLLLNKVNRM